MIDQHHKARLPPCPICNGSCAMEEKAMSEALKRGITLPDRALIHNMAYVIRTHPDPEILLDATCEKWIGKRRMLAFFEGLSLSTKKLIGGDS